MVQPDSSSSRPCARCGGDRHYTGTRWRCSSCYGEAQRRRRANYSPERIAQYEAVRTATRHGWSPEHRAQVNAKTAEWREGNREQHREGSRRWYRANAERLRAAKMAEYRADPQAFMARNLVRKARVREAVCEHGTRCVDRAFLAELYASQCLYCGDPAEHADHFVPLANGGLHCRDNVVPACAPCNLSKHASDPMAWIEARAS